MRTRQLTGLACICVALIACAGSDEPADSTSAPFNTASPAAKSAADDTQVVADAPFPNARCELNRSAGTITYLTGFDYAAAASIVDILVADQAGYYELLCLDVEIRASFSTANYPLVAENRAQFASGGSFSEVVSFAGANEAALIVTAVEGRTPIDALIVKSVDTLDLADLAGTSIGVKGKLPASVEAMLLKAGLTEGTDYDTTLIDGFDPIQHIAIDTIAGFPGYKSNEPGTLNRAGIGFQLFDPADSGIPGSFGAIYTNAEFVEQHRTAAEDFMRATMMGLADAIADPDAAAMVAVEQINANGNPNFLQADGEMFRWNTDAALIVGTTPEGSALGVPDPLLLQAELDAYAAVGFFGDDAAPDAAVFLDNAIIDVVYDEIGNPIWPS